MKLKKIFLIFLVILVVSMMVYSGGKLFEKYNDRKQTIAEIKDVDEGPLAYEETPKDLIIKSQKKYNNDEIIGVLKIEGAGINTLLVQTNDNSYYLNHLINKKENKTGSVFVDYRTNIDDAKQVNIYGHSSGIYDLPFDRLKKYLDEDFYKHNKIVTIDTINGSYEYEIFSVKVTSDEEHLNVTYIDDESFEKHLKKLKEDSLYETDVEVTIEDDVLVLQTCITNNPKGSLLIINLRKVG